MRHQSRSRQRGVVAIEAAVTIWFVIMIVVSTLELGIAIFRAQVLSAASRDAARNAAVHGSLATVLGPWGPATVGPQPASTIGPIPDSIRPRLYGLDPSQVNVTMEWLDGTNTPGSRVRVTISTSYQPVLAAVLGASPMQINAVSTVTVLH